MLRLCCGVIISFDSRNLAIKEEVLYDLFGGSVLAVGW